MVVVGDLHPFAGELEHRVVVEVGVLVPVTEELYRRPDQEQPEDHEGEREVLQGGSADSDEDGAQDEGERDTDQQRPLLQLTRDGEAGEDDDEDEEVVDRQALLHQPGRVVLGAEVGPACTQTTTPKAIATPT